MRINEIYFSNIILILQQYYVENSNPQVLKFNLKIHCKLQYLVIEFY
jgi:hypothetical protein